ncbi:MAG TPA: amino acid adenylation domain-containing protein [Thermoanaerobaculia bacterium]|nr:amino acid adenylation domain-containing protein [Thermoanaerobaculia bacterium]
MSGDRGDRSHGFKLSDKRRELLQAMRRDQGLGDLRSARIPRQPPGTSCPLSFSQQRLWFLDRLHPGNAAYNLPVGIRLRGRLELPALAAGFRAVVRRHALLRTTFPAVDGEPAQRIGEAVRLPLPVADGSALPAERRESWAERLAAALARRPFDLARGPLLRAAVLRLDEADHLVLVTLHHIVADGWSLEILIGELAACYRAAQAGRPAALPELPIQYADFAAWQRGWAQAGGLDAHLAYWRQQLAGAPTVLDLPADRPRPAIPSLRGGSELARFGGELAARLEELSARCGATLFMTLTAVLAALLAAHTGQRDLLIGTLVANRGRSELEGLIGFFANTLVLRAELGGDPPFTELLARLRETTLGALAHQELPFERLVEELSPERALGEMPLFQVLLVLQSQASARVELPELSLRPEHPATGLARLDLGISAVRRTHALVLEAVYSAELFDRTTVRRLLLRCERLAAAVVAEPERRLSQLPLLAPAELHQVTVEWAFGAPGRGLGAEQTDPKAPRQRRRPIETPREPRRPIETPREPRRQVDSGGAPLLHRAFEWQVKRGPARTALVAGGERWSYGELNRWANRLARRLRARGVGPERIVGICMERSPAQIGSILAVLKAGGAYLPLPPDTPADRLAFLLADAQPAAVLADPALVPAATAAAAATGLAGIQVLCSLAEVAGEAAPPTLDAPAPPRGAGGPGDPADPGDPGSDIALGDDLVEGAGPANLCYVIYTSGSSGKPKGVMIPHHAVCQTLRWRLSRFALGEHDRILQNIAFNFDPSIWQLFGALLSGARLALVAPGAQHDFAGLVRTVAREAITITDLAPSMLQAFLEQEGLEECRGLRLLFAGGEALPPELAERFAARFPAAALQNIYGPTEAAIDASTWTCAPLPAGRRGARSLPIGRPIDGKRLLVLAHGLEPAPIGVPGELFIGGSSLARGYLAQPALTAERFLPDPWASAGPGSRLYRTGDLVRQWPDGLIEFLGRLDRQIKVRGFRVELGEIEAVLGGHPRVRESAVVAHAGDSGEMTLAAYFAPPWPQAAAELRALLRARVPSYMVPAALVALTALPRTAGGKVDAQALPPIAELGPVVERAPYVPPATELERALAGIWRELLGASEVGLDDNFFDLGGHSLLLVRVHGRVQKLLGRDLPMVDLFTHPTIGALAAHLATAAPPPPPPLARSLQPAQPAQPAAEAVVAVVGMAGRFPGARDVAELWRNLREGKEAIRFFTAEELRAAGVDPAVLALPGYVPARGALDEFDRFDAGFFDLSPREAEVMDPQHRLFLELCWEALEDAGYDPSRCAEPVGVYAGVSANTYLLSQLLDNLEALREAGRNQTMLGSDKDFLATRVSYKLDLRGPSCTVQTACSTSLVAVHMACRALLGGECGMALAGGVSVAVPQVAGYFYEEGGINSPDGHCRAFDARARGTVGGSGAGVVVLKRLGDALAGGDTIHAVILGSAINNDGAVKVGYTAPSVAGQAAVIAAAQRLAGVSPGDISYVEAHGTGTPLGDPIEIAALARVFGVDRPRRCAIGSIKTNIGHLDAASGVAGLIKAVLALEHRELPPSLHYERPNPQIDFAATPFYVNAELAAWPPGDSPRRAGVSSFGIGGTNAHAVLEEAPPAVPTSPSRRHQLLLLSARSASALEAATDRLAGYLVQNPDCALPDVAYTCQVGRQAMSHRRVLVASDAADAAAALASRQAPRLLSSARSGRQGGRPQVAFLFPGQGAQRPGMAGELYAAEPAFRAALDLQLEVLAPLLPGIDLRDALGILEGPEGPDGAARREARGAGGALRLGLEQTILAQPLLFAVEYALARLWMEWGVIPAAMLGHSLGEYVAACLAGVFTLEDALTLVARRALLMQKLPPGAMLGVPLAEARIAELLAETAPELALAAVNGPELCVVSGPVEAIDEFLRQLAERGVAGRCLRTSHAFHSAAMDAVMGPFTAAVRRVALRPPALPYLSNLTGSWIEDAQATDPGYWARHLRQPVRFADGLGELLRDPERLLLEVGPGSTLSTLARRQAAAGAVVAVESLPRPGEEGAEQPALLAALGRLWLAGVTIDWPRFSAHETRRRLPLPTYPFERQRYWLEKADGEPRKGAPAPRSAAGAHVHMPPASAGAHVQTGPASAAADVQMAPAAGEPSAERTDGPGAGQRRGGHARPELATPYVAPRTDTERRLAAILESVLGIDRVGVHDGFGELGGHSLLALQVVARLRSAFAVELPLRAIFDAPTVAALAVHILEGEARSAGSESLEQMLDQLDGLSDEQAEALLRGGVPLAAWKPGSSEGE